MDAIKEVIARYLDAKATDHALLISGPWGSGKSYFIKNVIIPHIEAISINTKEKWKTVYLSLYGISECEQLMRMLLYSRLPGIGKARITPALIDAIFDIPKPVPKVGGFVEAFSNAEKGIEKLLSTKMNFRKHVILLDDLERVGPSVQISQLFGLVFSQLIEPTGVKIVFIGNEDILRERWRDYPTVREKIIRRVLLFQPHLKDQITEYLKEKYAGRRALLSFLNENIELIVELWKRVREHNLRSLGFAIDNFSIIHAFRDEGDLGQIMVECLELILMLSIEFKEGVLSPSDINDYNDLDNLQSSIASWRILSERSKGSDEKKPYYVQFYEKYVQGAKRRFVFSKNIYRLILSGSIDRSELIREAANLVGKGKSEEELEFDRLVEYRTCEEDELNRTLSRVLRYAEEGKYPIVRYPYLYSLLKYISGKNYLPNFPDDYAEKLAAGIEAVDVPADLYIEPTVLSHSYFSEAAQDPIFMKMVAAIKAKASMKGRIELKTKVESFLDNLNAIDHTKFLHEYNELRSSNLFQTIVEEGLVPKVLLLSNSSIYRIEIILHDRFINLSNAAQVYPKEREFLLQISSYIRNKCKLIHDATMKKQRLLELADSMGDSASKLEPPKTS